MPSNLYDYYSGQGKALPSVGSRFSDPNFSQAAAKAGVTSGAYKGTAEQNTAIMNNLGSVPSIPKPTTVVSSVDKAQEFDANKGVLDKKTAELANANLAPVIGQPQGTVTQGQATTTATTPKGPTTPASEKGAVYNTYDADYAAAKAQADKDKQARIDEQTRLADSALSRLGTAYDSQRVAI